MYLYIYLYILYKYIHKYISIFYVYLHIFHIKKFFTESVILVNDLQSSICRSSFTRIIEFFLQILAESIAETFLLY